MPFLQSCNTPTKTGKLLYIVGEMSVQVSVHTLPVPGTAKSQCLQRLPINPPSDNVHVHEMLSSAIKLWNGKLLCSNRDSPAPERDAIAIFDIAEDGMLNTPQFIWPGVSHIREMAPSPDGRFLCVGGRDGGGVVVFDRKWKVLARGEVKRLAIPVWMF